MSTDLELLKQLIDYHGTFYGDLKGVFIPLLRAYFLLTGITFGANDSIQVCGVEYKDTWDSHSELAYVSLSRHSVKYYISVWHHEGGYMVFDGLDGFSGFGTEAERELNGAVGAGKKGCILEFICKDGLYDSFVEIKKWIIYKGLRDDLGLDDDFGHAFKGFAAFKKYLATI